MVDELREKWFTLAGKYSSDQNTINILFYQLTKAYSEKGRHYHNLQHILNMLNGAEAHKALASDHDALCFAIWYHDLVYNPMKGNNEELSADEAGKALKKLGLDAERIEKVQYMILRTKKHTEWKDDDDADISLLLDLDLAILGASPEKYEEYKKQVREEYRMVPGFMYRKGRKSVLQQFFTAPHIYRLEVFREKLEENARNNLSNEIEVLSR
jgi:predicted metal-dependent HD superfamily phosphohydrolase